MREIKFRVWNGSAYEYDVMVGKFGVFYVNPMNNGLDATDSASLSPYNTKFGDDVVIEQFTGLLDKNGKKIFEGDIYVTDYNQHTLKNNVQVLSVGGAFCGGKTCLRCSPLAWDSKEDDEELYLDEEFLNHVVVIGNIHDNPELLEAK